MTRRAGRFWKPVLKIQGEEDRHHGTNHDGAYESARNLLNRFSGRSGASRSEGKSWVPASWLAAQLEPRQHRRNRASNLRFVSRRQTHAHALSEFACPMDGGCKEHGCTISPVVCRRSRCFGETEVSEVVANLPKRAVPSDARGHWQNSDPLPVRRTLF